MTDFKTLKVWQKSHLMAMNVHRVAADIRGSKHGSLRSQMTRAAMSVPTNIVEGCGQQGSREFSRYLRIALNSTSELEYHVLAARDLKAIRDSEASSVTSQLIEIRKMLYGLIRYLAASDRKAVNVREATTTNAD